MKQKIPLQRLRLKIFGAVQGVGFRPFVFNLAEKFDLRGFVGNDSRGVFAEVEGTKPNLINFQKLLRENTPPLAHITSIEIKEITPTGETDFRIVESESRESESTLVSPDMSVCDDCLRELFDVNDRRFRYPFINCTNCGPRFTIIKDLPYDRPKTTMSVFQMCRQCQTEYENPLDRRFHAQPIACTTCGPSLFFCDAETREHGETGNDAIEQTTQRLQQGQIVAIKGIGGFHLACDARNDSALQTLRTRKGRIDKPFAVMCKNLETAQKLVEISETEKAVLSSRERPIILLRKKPNNLSELVAPHNQFLGVMLPYSPLHHLLFNEKLNVLVMTSGNFSNEPIVTDNDEALDKLSHLADSFLLHNRDIFLPCDDSVMRIADLKSKIQNPKSEIVLPYRRSRGYAPFPVQLPFKLPPVLAVGGELKATFCLAKGEFAFMSQHIGDMENLETLSAFEKSVDQMRKTFRIEPEIVAFDRHPNYLSAKWVKNDARKIFKPETKLIGVQHHHAHIASVMAENGLPNEKVIGFAFDGTGYGTDGAIWGGEVLLADYRDFERLAHLRYVPLAGGDVSIKKPYRVALAHLRQVGVDWNVKLPPVTACSQIEQKVLIKQFEKGFNTVPTSSFGRLFDAVASIAGVRQIVTYEAQAAMEFEALADETIDSAYEFNLIENESLEIDCAPLIQQVALDVLNGISIGEISAKFNNAAANLILRLAQIFRERKKINKVALSGGCFQNVALLKTSLNLLRENDFEVLTHRLVPPNDGGLALGQAVIAGFSYRGNRINL
jgi:hydrogenase maturation protein HypF